MKLFNSHIHTSVSPDCPSSPDDMAEAAYHAGLCGIIITDHCSGSNFISFNSYALAKKSKFEALRLKEKYNGKMEVLSGIEFEEMLWCPEYAKRLLSSMNFDFVLASVHKVTKCPTRKYFSRINFSKFSKEDILTYTGWYFEDILKTAKECDFDSLAHLTVIQRYICGKYGLSLDMSRFSPVIDKILTTLAERKKALEINTSEVSSVGLMPNEDIIKRFKELGGEYITIGTDAHLPQNIDKGFFNALSALKNCGFDYYVYYKNREVQKIYI